MKFGIFCEHQLPRPWHEGVFGPDRHNPAVK
jgi:hypothetical protein